MTEKAPLTELERRHQALDQQIEMEQLHLSADDLKLAELKRQRLQLKDQMVKLKESVGKASVH